jgi:hypothetical protein
MNVNLSLKFKIYDRTITAKELKNIIDFNETTCIKSYKADDYNVNISLLGIEYVYEKVPLDKMTELYNEVRNYEGLISIIINEFGSR